MKIGLLGGTFNPIHIGHLVLAQECWHQLLLDKVIFIPAYLPPHKGVEGKILAPERLNMLKIALGEDIRFEISTYEIDKGGTSYSIDTIKYFRNKYSGKDELFFLTGADALETLSTWKDVDDILKLVTFVIANRPGWGRKSPFEAKVKRIIIPNIDVSSNIIRDRIRDNKPIDYLVPLDVARYIRDKGLYC